MVLSVLVGILQSALPTPVARAAAVDTCALLGAADCAPECDWDVLHPLSARHCLTYESDGETNAVAVVLWLVESLVGEDGLVAIFASAVAFCRRFAADRQTMDAMATFLLHASETTLPPLELEFLLAATSRFSAASVAEAMGSADPLLWVSTEQCRLLPYWTRPPQDRPDDVQRCAVVGTGIAVLSCREVMSSCGGVARGALHPWTAATQAGLHVFALVHSGQFATLAHLGEVLRVDGPRTVYDLRDQVMEVSEDVARGLF